MAHFTQRLRNKDPFSVQPVPKSFYFPSPKKYVEGSEAIQAPQHAFESDAQKDGTDLKENYSSKMFKTLPTVLPKFEKTINRDEFDTHYDEIWPDSERPSSPSANENTSALTAAVDSTVSGESTLDLQEAVNRLEFYDRYKSDTTSRQESKDVPAEESTLYKYIERFRKSEPKSREERMQEMQARKQEFWWLHGDSQDNIPASVLNKCQQKSTVKKSKESKDEPQLLKLTKEALTAMDEATLHLQAKADRLLSKSEMSVPSSGPIVSTDGLGTSCSVSDQSTIVDAPSYRPAFINVREHCNDSALPKYVMRTEFKEAQGNVTPKLNCGDILTQWRFRRKMEESQDKATLKSDLGLVQVKPQKNTEMDARLEEFRKRLLSQRMLVTSSDIQFERQKMDMLLEKNEEQPLQDQTSSKLSQLPRDPVLERLQAITKNQDQPHYPSSFNNVPTPQLVKEPFIGIEHSSHIDSTQDDNKNNSSLKGQHAKEISLTSCVDPMLNKNNTASSNCQGLDDKHYTVDNMDMIVIGSAKSRVYSLKDSDKESNIKKDNFSEKHKDVEALSVTQSQCDRAKVERKPDRSKMPLRDLPLNQISCKSVPGEKTIPRKDNISYENSRKKEDKDVAHGQIYHQYLQAEKPSTESTAHESLKDTNLLIPPPLTLNKSHNKSSSEIEDLVQSDNSTKSQSSRGKNSSGSLIHSNAAHFKKPKKNNFSKSSLKQLHHSEDKSDSSDCDIYSKQPEPRSEESSGLPRSLKEQRKKQPVTSTGEKREESNHNEFDHSETNYQCHSHEDINRDRLRKGTLATEKDDRPRALESRPEIHNIVNTNKAIIQTPVSAQPVKSAIGQTVRDHMFDGSLLLSSVDSWTSVFPPSPVPAHSSQSSEAHVTKTPSPARKTSEVSSCQQTPNQSTPLERFLAHDGEMSDDDSLSAGEFGEDPLLNLLRQQRTQYLHKLELIECRLQELNNKQQS